MAPITTCPSCEWNFATAIARTRENDEAYYRFECRDCEHIWKKEIL
jgi:DNA-directed RNA polymerase subunit M/transcription elongation factor TFIIS